MLEKNPILRRATLGGLVAFALLMPGSAFLAAQPQETPKPATPDVINQAEALVNQGKPDDAIGLLQGEIKRSPDQTDLQVALGNLAARAQRYGLAIESLRRAKELAPNDASIVSTLARALDAAERFEEAHAEYEAALALDADNFIALNNLAFLLSQYGDLDRALKLARRARELMPANDEISDTIGWIQMKRNMPDDSIAAFRQAIRGASSNPVFHYHLGMAFSQKGEKAEAIGELQAALTLDPSPLDHQKIRRLLDALQR